MMEMDIKAKIGIAVAALALAFASGRYSVQKPAVKDTVALKQQETSNLNKETVVKKTTTTVREPGGKETTTVVEDRDTSVTASKNVQTQVDTTHSETVTRHAINISALAGTNVLDPKGIVYGVSATKEMLGPITLGVFGLTNGILGASIGLSF